MRDMKDLNTQRTHWRLTVLGVYFDSRHGFLANLSLAVILLTVSVLVLVIVVSFGWLMLDFVGNAIDVTLNNASANTADNLDRIYRAADHG